MGRKLKDPWLFYLGGEKEKLFTLTSSYSERRREDDRSHESRCHR